MTTPTRRHTYTAANLRHATHVRDHHGNWWRLVSIERARVIILVAGGFTDTLRFDGIAGVA